MSSTFNNGKRKVGCESSALPDSPSKRQKVVPAQDNSQSTQNPVSLTGLANSSTAPVTDPPQIAPAPAPVPTQGNPAVAKAAPKQKASPAPAAVLTKTSPCPIDWTLPGLKAITADLKDCYLLKSPWKPESDYSNTAVEKMLNKRYNLQLGTEAWRKRFMKANRLAYLATGLWWDRMYIGLEKLFEKPTTAGQVTNSGPQRKRRKPQKYEDYTFTVYIRDPECTRESSLEKREIPLDLAYQSSAYIAEKVDNNQFKLVVKSTIKAVDIFFACFEPHFRGSLPKSCHRLAEDEDGTLVFIDRPLEITNDDLFDVYSLASILGSADVCDMVIDAWRDILQREVNLHQEYMTGARNWAIIPAEVPRILDFDPKSLNSMWNSNIIDVDDPVRTSWLDVLELKGQTGFQKIKADLQNYSEDFLNDWMERLPIKECAEIQQQLRQGQAQTQSDTVGDHLMGEVWGEIAHDDLVETGWGTEQSAFLPSREAAPVSTAWPKRVDASNEVNRLIERLGGDPVEFPPETCHDPATFLNGTHQEVCSIYHNHTPINDTCYKDDVPQEAADLEPPRAIPKRPAHHVEMTIKGTPGFIIQNHTGFSVQEFKELPLSNPDWDWERVRSVNFYKRHGDQEFHFERPAYWPEGSQDNLGRWPSHPGYGNANWVKPSGGEVVSDNAKASRHVQEELQDDDDEASRLSQDSEEEGSQDDEEETSEEEEEEEEEEEDEEL